MTVSASAAMPRRPTVITQSSPPPSKCLETRCFRGVPAQMTMVSAHWR